MPPAGAELRSLEDLGAAAPENTPEDPRCHVALPGIYRRAHRIRQAKAKERIREFQPQFLPILPQLLGTAADTPVAAPEVP